MSVIPPETPPGFTNPFDAQPGTLGQQAAFVTNVNFNIAVQTPIPYPAANVGATQLVTWNWVVISNYSSSVVFISDALDESRPVGIVAPGSADLFQVENAPQVGGMSFAALGPAPGTLTATWFITRPAGSYPTAIADIQAGGAAAALPITTTDTTRSFALGAGPFSFNFTPSPNFQSVAIQVNQIAGTATGFQIQITNGGVVIYTTTYPSATAGPMWIVPWLGNTNGPSVTITPILTKAAGGTAQLSVNVTYLQGLVPKPYFAGTATAHLGEMAGALLGISTGTTTTVLAEPPTGFCWRLRNVTAYYSTAPAAIQTVVLAGTSNVSNVYEQWEVAAAAVMFPASGIRNYLLNNANRLDPAEGLNVKNNASTTLFFWCAADLIPYPQAASDLSG